LGLGLVVVAGCGRIDFDPNIGTNARCTGPFTWTLPQPLPVLDSTDDDWGPDISPDSQLLVFSTYRNASWELFQASALGPLSWSAPTAVTALNVASCTQADPAWNLAGTRIYFARTCGQFQLWEADYQAGSFSAPRLVLGLETTNGTGPTVSTDELEMFFTLERPPVIVRATRPSLTSAWNYEGVVTELGTATNTGWPSLSSDGLTIFFESDVGTMGKIFTAHRDSVGAPFSTPTPVVEANDPTASDGDPSISSDCETLYIASDRQGGTGHHDIYVMTRTN
jgi:Tol biopolymer transport system component